MTQNSIPQQGTSVGDASSSPYSADAWSLNYTALLSGWGRRANYGVILGLDAVGVNVLHSLDVQAIGGATVRLQIGAAMVRGTLYVNDSFTDFTVQANISGNPRIDTLIVRKDYVAQTIRALVLQGTPAASPVPPTLTQSATVWEIPIVDIAVANGFSSIATADLLPRQEFINVGDGTYDDNVLNNSGGELNDGDVVVWEIGGVGTRSVTTTTTLNSHRIAGVWRGRTANGQRGRMQTSGFGRVKIRSVGAGAVGSPIIADSTAKAARPLNDIAAGAKIGWFEIGKIMQQTSIGTALYFCHIDVRPPQGEDYILIQEIQTSGTNAGGFTSGADRTRTLNSLVVDTTGQVTLSTNQFTLPVGRYRYRLTAPAFGVDSHRALLFNVTGAGTVAVGTSEYSNGSSVQSRSEVEGIFTIGVATAYEIRHRCQTSRITDGMGKAAGFGTNEVYAQIELWRVNDKD
ncbi:MAG: hypothetical protein ABI690_13590 [Chloroflexota bacterium]